MIEFVEEMDELLDGLDCRLRVSGMVADSIMMGIVNSTMEIAFQKACSKEGNIERLNEKSRFCELAVMQLEWCLKFVQENTDSYLLVEKSGERENLVLELRETRDRIKRRLEETELAISRKDKELNERFEIELKLRQALESKERELRSLSEGGGGGGGQDLGLSSDDSINGDFCELKNSVNQQFLNIQQKLEDERVNLSSGVRKNEELCKEDGENEVDFYRNVNDFENSGSLLKPEINEGFHKMRSDIDVLKETLDFAFRMMNDAISLSEVRPMEEKWRWTIEKEMNSVVFRGFLRDIQDDFGEKMRVGKKQSSLLLTENWSKLMNEITSLRQELDQLMDQVKTSKRRESMSPPSQKDVGPFSRRTSPSRGKPISDEASSSPPPALIKCGKPPNVTPLKIKDSDTHEEQQPKDNSPEKGSLVAEMIRNHETIIRRKNAESNWLKGEILRENWSSSSKKDTEPDTLKARIQDIILRLDSIIEGNAAVDEAYDSSSFLCENDIVNVSIREEIQQLRQEREFSNMESEILGEIYAVLFKGLVKEYQLGLYNYFSAKRNKEGPLKDSCLSNELLQNIEGQIREDVCTGFLRETFKELNEELQSYNIENHIREDIYQTVVFEGVQDGLDNFTATQCQTKSKELSSSHELFQNFEGLIQEDVCKVFLREVVKEWNRAIESFKIESHIREDVDHIISVETMRELSVNHLLNLEGEKREAKHQVRLANASNSFQSLASVMREDVCKVFFKEVLKEWKEEMECFNTDILVDGHIYQIVIGETLKDINLQFSIHKPYPNHENILELCGNIKLSKERETHKREKVSTRYDLTERNMNVECENLDHETLDQSILVPRETFGLDVNKLDKVPQEISSAIAVGDPEKVNNQTTSIDATWLSYVFTIIGEFSQEIVDFERMVQQKIDLKNSRLEEIKCHLQADIECVISLRKKETLYRSAFLRRCYDLQKAENEVDLLGDEVDALIILLEKIYRTIEQYLPDFQNNFEVMEILELIRKELNGPNCIYKTVMK